jgi:GTPase SAR1 family protein
MKSWRHEEELSVKVLVLGSSRVGKSYLIRRLVSLIRSGALPTNTSASSSDPDTLDDAPSPRPSASPSSGGVTIPPSIGPHLTTVRLRRRHVHQAATADTHVQTMLTQFARFNSGLQDHHNTTQHDPNLFNLNRVRLESSPIAASQPINTFQRLTMLGGSSSSTVTAFNSGSSSSEMDVVYPPVILQFWEIPEQELHSGVHLKTILQGVAAVFVLINASSMESLQLADKWATTIQDAVSTQNLQQKFMVQLLAPKFARGPRTFIPSSQLERYCNASPVFTHYSKLDMDQDKSVAGLLSATMPEIIRTGIKYMIVGNDKSENEAKSAQSASNAPSGQAALLKSTTSETKKLKHYRAAATLEGEYRILKNYGESMRAIQPELDDALSESVWINQSEKVDLLKDV